MPDSDDDALPRARRRPGDAPQADQPGETRRSHRAHGGWAVTGVSVLQGTAASLRRSQLHTRAEAQCFQGRTERPVPVRFREEIQEMLRRGDGELTRTPNSSNGSSPPRSAIIEAPE